MQPMFSELCEWTTHIFIYSILVFYYFIANLILCLQYCAMLTVQPILIPTFFGHKKTRAGNFCEKNINDLLELLKNMLKELGTMKQP